MVVVGGFDGSGTAVVKVWESNLVFGSDLVSDNEFVDVVEFVPVLVLVEVSVQRLELGSSRDGAVECLGGEERVVVEQVEIVLVSEIAEQL